MGSWRLPKCDAAVKQVKPYWYISASFFPFSLFLFDFSISLLWFFFFFSHFFPFFVFWLGWGMGDGGMDSSSLPILPCTDTRMSDELMIDGICCVKKTTMPHCRVPDSIYHNWKQPCLLWGLSTCHFMCHFQLSTVQIRGKQCPDSSIQTTTNSSGHRQEGLFPWVDRQQVRPGSLSRQNHLVSL